MGFIGLCSISKGRKIMTAYKPTAPIGKYIDIVTRTITQPQADRFVALGLEAALIIGDALVWELRNRYFHAHPDRRWLTDPSAVEIE
jgi:hypothetical protein